MTATTETPAPSLTELAQRVGHAAGRFPGDGLVAGPADAQDQLAELLPSDDAFVVIVPLASEVSQQLVLVVSQQLLTPMGLADAQGLPDALAAVIAELAAGASIVEDEIRVAVGPSGLDGLPSSADVNGELVAAGLFLGAEHVATIGIGVRTAAEASAGEAVAGMDLPEVAATRGKVAPSSAPSGSGRSLDLLRNVTMNVTAELGRSRMTVAELLSLTPGSVVELDRTAGSPIDLLVNGTLLARGEVVVIDEEFGIRISEIVDRAEGI